MSNPTAETSVFAIGEIVIGQGFDYRLEHNGAEGTVLSRLIFSPMFKDPLGSREPRPMWCYRVVWSDGVVSTVPYYKLRKKRLPPEEVEEDIREELEA